MGMCECLILHTIRTFVSDGRMTSGEHFMIRVQYFVSMMAIQTGLVLSYLSMEMICNLHFVIKPMAKNSGTTIEGKTTVWLVNLRPCIQVIDHYAPSYTSSFMHSKDIAILLPFLSLPLYSLCSASLVLKFLSVLCSCQVICLQKNLHALLVELMPCIYICVCGR